MDNNNQIYKIKVLVLTFLVIAITGIILYFYQSQTLKKNLYTKIKYVDSLIHKDFDSKILFTQKEYSAKVDSILKIDGLTHAFASKNREELYRLVSEKYKEYKKLDSYLKIITFRLVDGSTFLRVHKPKMYGDKLNKKRTIITDVNTQQKKLFGFEIGKLKMSYRIVTPIFHNSKYIGLVEVGILPEKFINGISNLFNIKNALMVKTRDVKIQLDKKHYLTRDNFSLISDDIMFKDIFNILHTKHNGQKSFLYINNDDKNSYIVENDFKLLNQNNQIVAEILLAFNITNFQKVYKESMKKTIILIISIGILLLLLLYVIFSRYNKEISKSEELLNTVFNTTSESIALLDLESNFLLVNNAYVNMTGFTKKELYTKSCVELTTPDTLDTTEEAIAIVFEKGACLSFEKSCFIKSGKIIDVRVSIVLMPDKERLLMTVDDITFEKRSKKENKLKDQQILQQSRLAQMGEMISMIAHQWRQPLTAISATISNLNIKLMMGDKIDNDFLKKELNLIGGYSQHLSKTIDDFRGFFKDNKIKENTTLKQIVSGTLDIVQTSVENKNIKIITHFNCNEKLKTYSNEVKQVVLNIIKNAEDILIEKDVENPTITIEVLCDANCSGQTLIIKDNAGGIPEDIIDKIFDPYFSTKKEKDGTGLGLYMSKTIIEEHCGGKISVSNDDEGAVFKIEFIKENIDE